MHTHHTCHHRPALLRLLHTLTLALLVTLPLASCHNDSEEETGEYAQWQQRNATYWDKLYTTAQSHIAQGDKDWLILRTWSINDTVKVSSTNDIVVHRITEGQGSGSPLYTDSVRVHYVGRLMPTTEHPEGLIFDKSMADNLDPASSAPAKFLVSGLTDGFATALQHMKIGDVWDVYVPWTLGYGTELRGTIPAYSVLTFRMQLVSYYRAGTKLPDFNAKQRVWITE